MSIVMHNLTRRPVAHAAWRPALAATGGALALAIMTALVVGSGLGARATGSQGVAWALPLACVLGALAVRAGERLGGRLLDVLAPPPRNVRRPRRRA